MYSRRFTCQRDYFSSPLLVRGDRAWKQRVVLKTKRVSILLDIAIRWCVKQDSDNIL